MISADQMLVPLVLAEVREGLTALGYRVDKAWIAGDAIHVLLANGRRASVDIPIIVNVVEVGTDLAAALDDRLRE